MPQPVLQKGGLHLFSRSRSSQAKEIIYRVNFVDGSELEVTLDETSSVQDAVVAIAHQKGSLPEGM